MIKIFEELPVDVLEVEELLDLTFGPGRNALSSYRFRDGVDPIKELCFVMRDDYNVLVGVIRFWPIFISLQKHPSLLLGPLGIHPTRQGEGLGEILISTALKKAKKHGWLRVLLVGDIDYYKRFCFSQHLVEGIYLQDKTRNERLLGLEIVEGSLSNLVGPILNIFDTRPDQ